MSDEETLYFLRLPMEERRKLPYAPPFISEAVRYRLSEEQRLAAQNGPGKDIEPDNGADATDTKLDGATPKP